MTAMDITYDRTAPRFTELIETIQNDNVKFISARFADDIAIISEGLDLLYAIMIDYAWLFNIPHIAKQNRAKSLLFSCLHKNQIAFQSCLQSTKSGFLGTARPSLRHIFEALMIAKFCAIGGSMTMLDNWEQGNEVWIGKGVINKIITPSTEVFTEFWGFMSAYTHASVYAQQVAFNAENTKQEIALNFNYIRILLDCQYHLLISHFITPSMTYIASRHLDCQVLREKKEKIRNLLTRSRQGLPQRPREVIRNYKATWVFKT